MLAGKIAQRLPEGKSLLLREFQHSGCGEVFEHSC